MARELEVNDSSRRTSQRREGTMNATWLIEEWKRQGRILEVEGANTVLWDGPGRDRYLYSWGSHF
jgi:hypothetical protein